jgi:hypothetical protein
MSPILSKGPPPRSETSIVELPKVKMRPLCGGVVIFDNRDDMSDGWACAHGGSPFRVRNPAHLPNDVIWVCNADYNTFQLQQSKLHHVRRDDYFRSTLTHIATDLGFRAEGEYAEQTAQKLAEVVHRAFTLAVTLYGKNGLPMAPRESTLADDIRRGWPPMKGLSGCDYLRVPLTSAYQSYSSPNWTDKREMQGDLVSVMLRLNRLDAAIAMFSQPVPDEAWHYIPEESAQVGMEAWLDPQHPSLVEVQVMLRDDVGELIAFGAQPGKRSGIRTWVSQPELRFLVEHADVNVRSGFTCIAPRVVPLTYRLPQQLGADPLLSLSYSAGLVAECHWHAVANPPWSRGRKEVETFPINVWQRAYDRATCFRKALAAHKAGFIVKGYGNGSLLIRAHRSELDDVLQFAATNGFAHPAFPAIFREHDATLPELLHG